MASALVCPCTSCVKRRLLCSKRKFPFCVAIRIISLFRLAMCVRMCAAECVRQMGAELENGNENIPSRRTDGTKGIEAKSYTSHRLLLNI